MPCVCGNPGSTETCCGPIIKGQKKAPTAEALMRSRYSAYALGEIDYILRSVHPSAGGDVDRESTEAWSKKSEWRGLEIVSTSGGGESDDEGEVEFIARFAINDVEQKHHERGKFKRHEGEWRYVDGKEIGRTVVREGPRIGRNDPCHCGSGKKFKRCHGR